MKFQRKKILSLILFQVIWSIFGKNERIYAFLATLHAYTRRKPLNGVYEPLMDKNCSSFVMSPARKFRNQFEHSSEYDISMYSLPSTVSLSAKALLIGTRKMQTDPEPTREFEAGTNLVFVRPPSLLEMDGIGSKWTVHGV